MVGSDAGLTSIETLAPGQALGAGGDVGIGKHDRRTLAAQLQGHGGEMAGGGGHHQPADPAAPGEKDVVKLLLQQLGCHGPIASDHLHHLGRKGQG